MKKKKQMSLTAEKFTVPSEKRLRHLMMLSGGKIRTENGARESGED